MLTNFEWAHCASSKRSFASVRGTVLDAMLQSRAVDTSVHFAAVVGIGRLIARVSESVGLFYCILILI